MTYIIYANKCFKVIASLNNYLKGDVTSRIEDSITKHMVKCSACKKTFDKLLDNEELRQMTKGGLEFLIRHRRNQ